MDTVAATDGEAVARLLYEEAASLDERRWDDWLALYEPDAEYWIPAWDSEHEHTQNPLSELSLMYYGDRSGLEDRVFRIRTGKSSASTPLPRTCHMIGNIRVDRAGGDGYQVRTHWTTHLFRNGEVSTYFGRAEYLLARRPDGWGIRRKKTLVLNDRIDTVLDIYSV
jgi:3-phenylpropionate/cinnamic acid dioxygenase small subunit